MRRRTLWTAGVAGTCLVAGAAVVVTLTTGRSGHGDGQPPEAVSTVDVQSRVCLLVGAAAGSRMTDEAWMGVRQAATRQGNLLAQQFRLPQKVAAATYLRTLAQMRCAVVVTVGKDVRPSPEAGASGGVRYVVVGDAPVSVAGATRLRPADASASTVAEAVVGALQRG